MGKNDIRGFESPVRMIRVLIQCLLPALLFAGSLCAQVNSHEPLTAVPEVDLSRYMGIWYEIARLPNKFQDHCTGDVTATYSLLDDGDIKVINSCRRSDGGMSVVEGRAKRAGDDEPDSKLKVRFAPAILSFLPFVWGDYWIILLAPDYSHAVIGEPDRKYLWILARTPSIDDAALENLLDQIRLKGYDLTGLLRTKNAP